MAVFIHSLLIYYAIVGEHRERVFRLPLQKLGILARVFCLPLGNIAFLVNH